MPDDDSDCALKMFEYGKADETEEIKSESEESENDSGEDDGGGEDDPHFSQDVWRRTTHDF